MKLLFDQNISYRVANKLKDEFPGSGQVRELHLENQSDKAIWDFAKNEQFTIVTFDADFYDMTTLLGHPPKIVWLRMGNTRSEHLIEVILHYSDIIKTFITDSNYAGIGCLEISGRN